MPDIFAREPQRLESPGNNCAAVTPSDSTDLAIFARSLWVDVTGNIKITTPGGSTETFNNVPVGIFPMRVARVWATGTTATGIKAVW